MAAPPFPFRVQKPFVLHGEVQERGAVIDVSTLSDVRVRQLENAGLGIRVSTEIAPPPSRGKRARGAGNPMSSPPSVT